MDGKKEPNYSCLRLAVMWIDRTARDIWYIVQCRSFVPYADLISAQLCSLVKNKYIFFFVPMVICALLSVCEGCVFQQSPFAICHPHPLCNTTGVCPNGKQWCSLTESCLDLDHPCSIYTSEGFLHPPRYVGTSPLYSPIADIPLLFSPSRKRRNIQVRIDDVLLINVYKELIDFQPTTER